MLTPSNQTMILETNLRLLAPPQQMCRRKQQLPEIVVLSA